jgi:hypothetical protein
VEGSKNQSDERREHRGAKCNKEEVLGIPRKEFQKFTGICALMAIWE